MSTPKKHPIQPIEKDQHGVERFKANAIVKTLLDTHQGMDMNKIAIMAFSREDRVQFAQLIGYSVSGFSELRGYVQDVDVEAAEMLKYEQHLSSDAARADVLQATLDDVRTKLAPGLAVLFERHPDDFLERD